MATWLNVPLSGACTFTVFRDGVEVTNLATAGATLATVNGQVTLATPDGEDHEWEVRVSADFLPYPTSMRMRAFSLTHPGGLEAAGSAKSLSNGVVTSTIPLTVDPAPVSPDPAMFTAGATAASLTITEGGV